MPLQASQLEEFFKKLGSRRVFTREAIALVKQQCENLTEETIKKFALLDVYGETHYEDVSRFLRVGGIKPLVWFWSYQELAGGHEDRLRYPEFPWYPFVHDWARDGIPIFPTTIECGAGGPLTDDFIKESEKSWFEHGDRQRLLGSLKEAENTVQITNIVCFGLGPLNPDGCKEDCKEERKEDGKEERKEDSKEECKEDSKEECKEDSKEECKEDGKEERKEDGKEERKEDGKEERKEDGKEECKEDGKEDGRKNDRFVNMHQHLVVFDIAATLKSIYKSDKSIPILFQDPNYLRYDAVYLQNQGEPGQVSFERDTGGLLKINEHTLVVATGAVGFCIREIIPDITLHFGGPAGLFTTPLFLTEVPSTSTHTDDPSTSTHTDNPSTSTHTDEPPMRILTEDPSKFTIEDEVKAGNWRMHPYNRYTVEMVSKMQKICQFKDSHWESSLYLKKK